MWMSTSVLDNTFTRAPQKGNMAQCFCLFGHDGIVCSAYKIGVNFDISDQGVVWRDGRGRSFRILLARNFEEEGLPSDCGGSMDGCLISFVTTSFSTIRRLGLFSYKSRYGTDFLSLPFAMTECASLSLSTASVLHTTKHVLQWLYSL